MLAWGEYQASLCPGCGTPKETGWHWDNGGHFEVTDHDAFTCHACTARVQHGATGTEKPPPVTYLGVTYTRPDEAPLPGSWLEIPTGEQADAAAPRTTTPEEGSLA